MSRYRRVPEAVVVDTGRTLATLDRDPDGAPLTLAAARDLADQRNAERKHADQTWRPYRLAPDLPAWLVEQHADGAVTGWWLVYAADAGHALIHGGDAAAAAGLPRFPALGQPEEAEPGYRWTARTDGGRYEIRRLR